MVEYQDEKNVAKLGFMWVAVVACAIAAGLAILVGAIAGFNAVTAGPRDDLRSDFHYACNTQFDAGIFPPACVAFVQGGK